MAARADTEPWLAPADPDGAIAFARLYRCHHARIERLCRFRLGDTYEAEDVAQEAFVRAWRSPPAGANDAEMSRWLTVVAGNLCTDVLRKRKRAASAGERIGPPRLLDRIEDARSGVVEEALGGLSPRYRAVLMMRDAEGLSHREIARRLGTSPSGVESTLWRARRALRAKFFALAGPGGYLAGLPLVGSLFRSARPTRRGAPSFAARTAGLVATDAPGAAWTFLCGATAVAGLLGAPHASATAQPAISSPAVAPAALELRQAAGGMASANTHLRSAQRSSFEAARQPAPSGSALPAAGVGPFAGPGLPATSVPAALPSVDVNTEANSALNVAQSQTGGLPVNVGPTSVENDAPTGSTAVDGISR